MKITKIKIDQQRLLLTGIIVSDEFCNTIIPILSKNYELIPFLFTSFSKILIHWCLDYYEKYEKAPKEFIQNIYIEKKDTIDSESSVLIAELLEELANQYERDENYNEKYTINQCLLFLRKKSIQLLKQKIHQLIQNDELEEAEKIIEKYNTIKKEIVTYNEVDFFALDEKEIENDISAEENIIFNYPGALGEAIEGFRESDLIAFMAPEKRGKTWFLIDLAVRAVVNNLNVLFFSFEMSENQCKKRIYQYILGEINKTNVEKPVLVDVPFFEKIDNNMYEISYRSYKKTGLSAERIKKKIDSMKYQFKHANFRCISAPANTMTINDIDRKCDELLLSGFSPNIIIIDYGDIIQTKIPNEMVRHQINEKWQGMKNIASRKKCVVATVTHSNNNSMYRDLRANDSSEDKRKLAIVSVMIGINQTSVEKKHGVYRLSILAHRFEDYNEKNQICCLNNLCIARPILETRWLKDVQYDFEED